jgi:orotate phosphoribosyltransferase
LSPYKIAHYLLKAGAVTLRPEKPFIWASGIQSPIYCDNRLLLSYPEIREKIIKAFLKKIKKEEISFDAIAGIATAGIPHASILADRLGKPLLYVRASSKSHGKQNQIEGRFKKGERILVVEDLVSTGQSSLLAVQALRKAGAKVMDCLAIFSYGFAISQKSFQKMRCRLHTLTDLSALIETALKEKEVTLREKDLIAKFSHNPQGWLRN